jgi:hypothetical protein
MPLTKLQFRPGINKEISEYSNEGGWIDGDKIRFRFGYPEKIGGWIKYTSSTYLGTPRTLHAWITLAGDRYLGLGTNVKYFIESGGAYNDITPVRRTVRQPFVMTGTSLSATASVGTVIPLITTGTEDGATIGTDLTMLVDGVAATLELGTLDYVGASSERPLGMTSSLGTVTVSADDVVNVGD